MKLDDPARLLAAALGLEPGLSAFPWQVRLLERFCAGDVPRSLDIPTGLGKTATIAIWLLARALGAQLPRRLVYVVDRRAVVDQATEEAIRLRGWVRDDPQLTEALGLGERALPISTLRGQFVDNREWLEDPAAPAIVVGTVDMVGSRLLFSGYGTSRKMRPFHAALLGSDCLVVLDEAHLIPPFERLLERIVTAPAGLGPAGTPAVSPPRSRLLSLSATGRSKGGDAFDLRAEDLEHPIVAKRLNADKALSLEPLPDGERLAEALAERAWALAEEGGPVRCIVFVNKRDDAEKIAADLRHRAAPPKRGEAASAEVELLVGGRRVFERVSAADRLRGFGFLAGSDLPRERPAFLVATSAGEVGVDLDADHMTCDLVAWERMIQRLGRVNRRGEGAASVEVIVQPVRDKAAPEEIERHRAVLALIDALPPRDDGGRDASPGALRDLQRAAREDARLGRLAAAASSPEPLHPALDRPTLDAWAMTSLREHPGRPDVAPWLRGWIEDRPKTTLIWRQHLPEREGDLARFLEAAPPHASEKLELETDRVTTWLGKRINAARKRWGSKPSGSEGDLPQGVAAVALKAGGDVVDTFTWKKLVHSSKRDLEGALPHVTLVLDARVAGLSEAGLLNAKEATAPLTADGDDWLGAGEGEAPPVRFRVRTTSESSAITHPDWRERARFVRDESAESEDVTSWLVVEKWRHDAATEEDRSAGRPQLLQEHQAWAEDRARRLAERLDLPRSATEILAIAARLHDEGKRAARWQAAFHAPADGIYAKTRGPLNVHALAGYRHEFGSLPLAEEDPQVAALSPDERDLVLHLIASHHGFARPVIRTDGCERPRSAPELLARARDVALRYTRLQRRWGPWGLAWWEALLRSADQQASRDNDRAAGGAGR